MAKKFLRVSNNWTEIVNAATENLFLYNGSGSAVKIYLSSTPYTTEDFTSIPLDDTFTIGGTITQFCVRDGQYAYAKASIADGDEIIVTVNNSRIDNDEQTAITDTISTLTTQMMHLSNRVHSNQLDQLRFLGHNTLFVQQMLNSHMWLSKSYAVFNNQILKLHNRLFAAERFVDEYRRKWHDMEIQIADVLELKGLAQDIVNMESQIYQTAATVNNLNGTLNDLIPRVEEAWADYDQLVKEFINPLAETVDTLHQDFISLNNAITHLTEEHTPEEIEDTFQEIIRGVNSNMVPPLTGLKNSLVELCIASQDNDRQDISLSTKIDYTDQILVDPDEDVIVNLAGGNINETPTAPEEPEEPEPDTPEEGVTKTYTFPHARVTVNDKK